MGFDDVEDGDMRLQIEDVHVVIAPHHADLLEDTTLDFVELEPGQFNFIFVQQEAETAGSSAGGGCSTGGAVAAAVAAVVAAAAAREGAH